MSIRGLVISQFLKHAIRIVDRSRYQRRIERALALYLRGEARRDGLELKSLNTRLEIEWYARDIHPWDFDDSPEKKSALFVRDSLADTDAVITRLFQALPEIDVIALTVFEQASGAAIIAGTVVRSTEEPDSGLSAGMRLRQRGIKYRSDGFRFESQQA